MRVKLHKIGVRLPDVTESNEAYTDIRVINHIRNVFGQIDVDVAGNYLTAQQIQPVVYYSKFVDGLNEGSFWFGNVLVNPPYKSPEKKNDILTWIKKALCEWKKVRSVVSNLFIIVYVPSDHHVEWREILIYDSKLNYMDENKCYMYTLKRSSSVPFPMNGYYYSSKHFFCSNYIRQVYISVISLFERKKYINIEENVIAWINRKH